MTRLRPLLCLALLIPLACGKEDGGDDLPPGAFTSGPDDNGDVDVGESTTSGAMTTEDPSATSTTDDGESGNTSTGLPMDLTHTDDIMPIWVASCIDASCHDADGPQAGLDLQTEGNVYENICTGIHGFSGMPYIDCEDHDPSDSYIFRKIEGSHLDGDISGANGAPMPPARALTDEQMATISAWISQGAVE